MHRYHEEVRCRAARRRPRGGSRQRGRLHAARCAEHSGSTGTADEAGQGRDAVASTSASRPTSTRTTPRSPRARRSSRQLFDSLTAGRPARSRRRSCPQPPSPGRPTRTPRCGRSSSTRTTSSRTAPRSRRTTSSTRGTGSRTPRPSTPRPRRSIRRSSRYHLAVVKGFDDVAGGQGPGDDRPQGRRRHHARGHAQLSRSPTSTTSSRIPALAPVPQKYVEGGVDYQRQEGRRSATCRSATARSRCPSRGSTTSTSRSSATTTTTATKPNLDGVDFKIFKDPETAYTEFQAGNLDFTQIGDGQDQGRRRQVRRVARRLHGQPGQAGPARRRERHVLPRSCNNKDKYIDNANLRKAICLAINRQAICDTVFEGTRMPADNIVPPGIAGYEKGAWADAKYDVAGAQAALAAAGYPGGKGLPDDHSSRSTAGAVTRRSCSSSRPT